MSDQQWLERVSAELRSSAGSDSDFDRRVLGAVRRSVRRRRWAGFGAGLGVVLLALAGAAQLLRAPAFGTEVEFAIDLPAASAVTVVGDFNDWDRARTPLMRSADGTRWSARVVLAGGVYHYAFLVDGRRWLADPQQPFSVDGDYGQSVSMVTVQ